MEGVTEWLPISSTGHMLLLDEVLRLPGSPGFKDSFFVVIQLGAILAVIGLFREKMLPARGSGQKRASLLLWAKTALACVPGAIAVLLLRDAENRLESPAVIAVALIGYGIIFLLAENKRSAPRIRETGDIGFRDAFRVGLFQTLSVVPGTSRSGSTIIGGLAVGMDRQTAAEFSFFLAVPVMAGYSAVKLISNGMAFTPGEWGILIVGSTSAYLTSLLVVKRFMAYLKRHGFTLFGWYRIALGLAVLIKIRIK